MSAEGWAALASWIGAIVAIWALLVQTSRQRSTEALSIITKLEEEFESADFRAVRRAAATFFWRPQSDDHAGEQAAERLLNFFEKVGYVHAKNALTADAAWHFLGSWILPYWHASRRFVNAERRIDPNVFTDFDTLYGAVNTVEQAKNPTPRAVNWKEHARIVAFLSAEAGSDLPLNQYLPA